MENTAFVFPGQGSQSVGMGADLVQNFIAARRVFEEASDTIQLDLLRLCTEGPAKELNRTELTQAALLTTSMAVYRVLDSETGWKPAFVAGHSLGEYSAVTAAGGFDLADAVSLVRKRGIFMQEAVPEGEGAMAAILGMELALLQKICEDVDGLVVPANLNCPGQIVISGEREAVQVASDRAKEAGAKRALVLPVSVPSHSPLMEPVSKKLQEALDVTPMEDLAVPLMNNVAAEEVRIAEAVREGLVRQLTSTLRWEESIRAMLARGIEIFVEVGPGKVLSNLIRRIDRNVRVFNPADAEGLKNLLKEIPAGREV
ncbi:MAG: ACP S-malonyltransferase [Deltaproteobacteria bacterium]|nr:ACP S-malonyltransferase [Deltaproteobacteria bacterium]